MATIIKNVNIFDGKRFIGVQDVYINHGRIVREMPNDAEIIDGTGKTLLPGFWDCHIHIYDRPDFLQKSLRYGNTSLCDMGDRTREQVDKMKSLGIINILSPYSIAVAPGSQAVERMGYPESIVMKDAQAGIAFVHEMIDYGANYIKVIIEEGSGAGQSAGTEFPLEIGKAIVDEAHKHYLKVITHATTTASWRKALAIGADVITHMPMGEILPDDLIEEVARSRKILTPTIAMMEGIAARIHARNPNAPVSKDIALQNLQKFYQAGAIILASTDANEDDPCPPASVEYGKGLLDEFDHLKSIGMTTEEVLASATSQAALYFNDPERGRIHEGKIADLVLVDGNPAEQFSDIRRIHSVFVAGEKVA